MTVLVSFIKPGGLGHAAAVGVGHCRISETITVPGSTTATAQADEIVLICSSETAVIRGAHGTTPDAAATAATAASTAGYPVPSGQILAVAPKVGDKINLKVMS